jgi:Flp pilus assembly protein TadG
MPRRIRTSGEKGVALVLGVSALVFIIPMLGLSIDASVLYAVKGRMQSSVDGASLAAARALNLGQTTDAQSANAKQNAVNWFYANFPGGTWNTSNTVMSSSTVQVFDDATNPHVRNVTVTASTVVPTYFMRWFSINSMTLTATGNASRRDVVAMMVLDRSGSMSGTPCTAMKTAAKLFTGQFAAGRDYIGLVSFSDNVYIHSSPTQSFQPVLGYSNASGSGTGAIDTIVCAGGTSTAQAISIAYNEIYKTNLPGALNLIMFETDGLPNTLTFNFWPSSTAADALNSTSGCKDQNSKTIAKGGFTAATWSKRPMWTTGWALGTGSYFSDVPAGMVGGVYADDPNVNNQFHLLWPYLATSTSDFKTNPTQISSTATGCAFASSSGQTVNPAPADFAWFPTTDVYGNQLNPTAYTYKSVTTTSGYITDTSWSNYRNAVFNATDYAAYQARTNSTLPVYFFGIGLGGTSTNSPDYVLMQRMANDPNGDNYNSPAKYSSCASETGCTTYSNQPQGTFIYAADTSDLGRAFLAISSQVLRLSK